MKKWIALSLCLLLCLGLFTGCNDSADQNDDRKGNRDDLRRRKVRSALQRPAAKQPDPDVHFCSPFPAQGNTFEFTLYYIPASLLCQEKVMFFFGNFWEGFR